MVVSFIEQSHSSFFNYYITKGSDLNCFSGLLFSTTFELPFKRTSNVCVFISEL